MQVILIKDIHNLGRKGDVKNVADGFARNYLVPRGLAILATPEAIRKETAKKEQLTAIQEKDLEQIQSMASEIEGREFTLHKKVSKGKLFGSVSSKEIAEELEKNGFKISDKELSIREPIKETGEFRIELNLTHGIETFITLIIEEEK